MLRFLFFRTVLVGLSVLCCSPSIQGVADPTASSPGNQLLQGGVSSAASVGPRQTVGVMGGACGDVEGGACWSLPDHLCSGLYEAWSRRHCALRCGFCHSAASACQDELSNCDQFTDLTCTAPLFLSWARANCRKHCHLCQGAGGLLTSAAPSTTGSLGGGRCQDDPGLDCWALPDQGCFGQSLAWARQHCPRRCGFCAEPPCEDRLPHCAFYDDSKCQAAAFRQWAADNCRKRCKLCPDPCQYKGSQFQDGATWEVNCQQHCICQNGHVTCSDRCLNLQLPATCDSRPGPPQSCCPVPNCPEGVKPHLLPPFMG